MNNAITINTQFNTDEIRQELRDFDDIRGNVHEHIMNLRDQGVREALEKLGWTPPGEESVQNQLCARIDELERDKEVLAAQLDRAEERIDSLSKQANALHRIASTLDLWSQAGASVSIDAVAEAATKRVEELVTTEALAEEQLAMLRRQADALHRIGSTLDLDPGTDLTQEAPARVEALVAFRSAVCGWRESDWPESFCRRTAELVADHGRQAEGGEP